MSKQSLIRMTLAALFLALALILPFFTGQIPEIGNLLCPMHVPVLLCGFLLNWKWGLTVGATAPILRSLLFTMPPMYPKAICMALELAAYGVAAALLDHLLPKKNGCVYLSLIGAMLIGRAVWGLAMLACSGISGMPFGIQAFLAGAFTQAIPGILLQLCLIPPLVILAKKHSKLS